jgi:ribonuclease H2 subunit C
MLAIQSTNPQKCTPHLLPARVNHSGLVNDTQRYWQPTRDDKGTQHAYFRGRHLHGTSLPLPANYTGAVLHITDEVLPRAQSQRNDDQMEDDEQDEVEAEVMVDVKVAEKVGEFDEVVVWGHGGEVDGRQDAFVKGMEEWIGFAEAIHTDGDEPPSMEKKG